MSRNQGRFGGARRAGSRSKGKGIVEPGKGRTGPCPGINRRNGACDVRNDLFRIMSARTAHGLALGATLAAAATAQGAWTVTILNPVGSTISFAEGVAGAQQVGWAGSVPHAGLWHGTAESWVSLHPAGALQSIAYATSGTHQVGYTHIAGTSRASLWTGTAASWIDLSPAGSAWSIAGAIAGAQQAGYAGFDGESHAGMWTGTADSWVDLHPAGATGSAAIATSGTHQAGWASFPGTSPHAGIWSGTADSWVDLHPAGSTYSRATAMSDSHQAGVADFGGVPHAGMWSGTADSWVDLHPEGSTASWINAIFGTHHVGYADFPDGNRYPSLWTGFDASWEALPPPDGWVGGIATGVWSDTTTLFVVGLAFHPGVGDEGGEYQAVMWSRPIPAPGAAVMAAIAAGASMCMRRRSRVRFPLLIHGGGVFGRGAHQLVINLDGNEMECAT